MKAYTQKRTMKWLGTAVLFMCTALSGAFYIVKGHFVRSPAAVDTVVGAPVNQTGEASKVQSAPQVEYHFNDKY